MAHFAKITPLGRSPFVVRMLEEPEWNSSEVGGWLDGTAGCYIPPSRRLWLSGALCEFAGPYGPMHMGTVRTYDGSTLSVQGQHDSAMKGEPTLGHFCVTDIGAWRQTTRSDSGVSKNILMDTAALDASTSDALVSTWQAGNDYPASCWNAWVYDSGETQDIWLNASFGVPGGGVFHVVVYPLLDGAFNLNDYPLGTAVHSRTTGGSVAGLYVGHCRGVFIQVYCTTHITVSGFPNYSVALYGLSVYAGGVAPRFDASDGLTALRAADVASHLFSTSPAWMVGGIDVAEDLTPCEPFDIQGMAADQMAALLQISDAACWWEKRVEAMPWAVYRSRAQIPTIDLPAEDRRKVVCNLAPADISAMCSALKVHYTNAQGVTLSLSAYDRDQSHYLVQIGRFVDGAFGPLWGPDLDIGDATPAMAQQMADLFFAYTTHGVDGPAPWTGTIHLSDAHPFPAYFPFGANVRVPSLDYGKVTVRIRQSHHVGLSDADLTVDNTATASDMVSRAVEGLNRARAFTAARAIKTRVNATAAVKKAISKKVAAAKKKAAKKKTVKR